MPGPIQQPGKVDVALASHQKQIDRLTRRLSGASGGGVVGSALAEFTMGTGLPASTVLDPTATTLTVTHGTPDLAVDGLGIHLGVSALWLVHLSTDPISVSGGTASDLHTMHMQACNAVANLVVANPVLSTIDGQLRLQMFDGGGYTTYANMIFETVGASGRTFDVGTLYAEIYQLALPA